MVVVPGPRPGPRFEPPTRPRARVWRFVHDRRRRIKALNEAVVPKLVTRSLERERASSLAAERIGRGFVLFARHPILRLHMGCTPSMPLQRAVRAEKMYPEVHAHFPRVHGMSARSYTTRTPVAYLFCFTVSWRRDARRTDGSQIRLGTREVRTAGDVCGSQLSWSSLSASPSRSSSSPHRQGPRLLALTLPRRDPRVFDVVHGGHAVRREGLALTSYLPLKNLPRLFPQACASRRTCSLPLRPLPHRRARRQTHHPISSSQQNPFPHVTRNSKMERHALGAFTPPRLLALAPSSSFPLLPLGIIAPSLPARSSHNGRTSGAHQ